MTRKVILVNLGLLILIFCGLNLTLKDSLFDGHKIKTTRYKKEGASKDLGIKPHVTPPETYKDKAVTQMSFYNAGEVWKNIGQDRYVVSKKMDDGTVIYEAHYTLIKDGLREFEPRPKRKKILLLGCSFVFGEGLNDDETLMYYLKNLLQDFEIVSIARPGWGPNDVLLFLRSHPQYMNNVHQAFYFFIDDHWNRVFAPAHLVADPALRSYLMMKPYFEQNGEDFEYAGSIESQRKGTMNQVYRFLGGLPLLHRLGFIFPPFSDSNRLYFAGMLRQIEKDIQAASAGSQFAVVLYPFESYANGIKLKTDFEKYKLQIEDLTDYDFDISTGNRTFIPEDGHPTKYTNYLLAQILARKLH
jgi:hypothetical protein